MKINVLFISILLFATPFTVHAESKYYPELDGIFNYAVEIEKSIKPYYKLTKKCEFELATAAAKKDSCLKLSEFFKKTDDTRMRAIRTYLINNVRSLLTQSEKYQREVIVGIMEDYFKMKDRILYAIGLHKSN